MVRLFEDMFGSNLHPSKTVPGEKTRCARMPSTTAQAASLLCFCNCIVMVGSTDEIARAAAGLPGGLVGTSSTRSRSGSISDQFASLVIKRTARVRSSFQACIPAFLVATHFQVAGNASARVSLSLDCLRNCMRLSSYYASPLINSLGNVALQHTRHPSTPRRQAKEVDRRSANGQKLVPNEKARSDRRARAISGEEQSEGLFSERPQLTAGGTEPLARYRASRAQDTYVTYCCAAGTRRSRGS